jgi:hypothetical protein
MSLFVLYGILRIGNDSREYILKYENVLFEHKTAYEHESALKHHYQRNK